MVSKFQIPFLWLRKECPHQPPPKNGDYVPWTKPSVAIPYPAIRSHRVSPHHGGLPHGFFTAIESKFLPVESDIFVGETPILDGCVPTVAG